MLYYCCSIILRMIHASCIHTRRIYQYTWYGGTTAVVYTSTGVVQTAVTGVVHSSPQEPSYT